MQIHQIDWSTALKNNKKIEWTGRPEAWAGNNSFLMLFVLIDRKIIAVSLKYKSSQSLHITMRLSSVIRMWVTLKKSKSHMAKY